MIPEAMERLKESDLYSSIIEAGVRAVTFCPLGAFSVRLGNKHILTSSGKLYYYLSGTDYGTVNDCLRACGI
jgi:hypothetical protein